MQRVEVQKARRSVKIALGCQQLSQQHCAAGSAAQGVVAHAGELVIKQGVLTQTTDADGHAVLGVAVQLGLGTVVLLEVVEELLGCAGQVQFLCGAAELGPSLEDFFLAGLLIKAHEDSGGVTVRDRHTEALGRDDRLLGVDDVVALNMTPQLERLTLALFLLAADVGDDVVDDLRHPVEGLAGTGNGLIGADQSLADAEILHQGVQGRDIALQAAVGLDGDEAALGTQALALSGDDVDVVGVDPE